MFSLTKTQGLKLELHWEVESHQEFSSESLLHACVRTCVGFTPVCNIAHSLHLGTLVFVRLPGEQIWELAIKNMQTLL